MEANMANEVKLNWVELDAAMFPKEVQAALSKASAARKIAADATKVADDMLQTFATRIQVPNLTGTPVPLLSAGQSMVISHRFGKLTVAATDETKKAKTVKTTASLA
jgi:hypothetical protein